MAALRVILTILFIIVCIAIIVLVLLQEGKSAGLRFFCLLSVLRWPASYCCSRARVLDFPEPSAVQQSLTLVRIRHVPCRACW